MSAGGRARVLVVDDSPYVRQMLRQILEEDPLVGEVEGAGHGRMALDKVLRRPPDLITLDLEMPVMGGFTFLRLLRVRSDVPVLVVSSHADLGSVEKSLELGASGFLSKPGNPYQDLAVIAGELRTKLRQHLGLSRKPTSPVQAFDPGGASPQDTAFPVIAIGSSSGGPPTLQYLLSGLPKVVEGSVLIAQHMPPGFTECFANRLDSLLPYPVREARPGQVVKPGEVVVAPGGRHLAVERGPAEATLAVEAPGAALCAPSVDRLFETAAAAFGPRLTAVILTGMGKDGAAGVRAVKDRGGIVLAESESTAAIYGMPKEAAATGCVDEILPLPEIAVRLHRIASGVGPTAPDLWDGEEDWLIG